MVVDEAAAMLDNEFVFGLEGAAAADVDRT